MSDRTPRIRVRDVVKATALVYGCEPKVLLCRTSGKRNTRARYLAMTIAAEVTGKTRHELKFHFGTKDFTTVDEAIAVTQWRLEEDPELRATADRIRAEAKRLAIIFTANCRLPARRFLELTDAAQ